MLLLTVVTENRDLVLGLKITRLKKRKKKNVLTNIFILSSSNLLVAFGLCLSKIWFILVGNFFGACHDYHFYKTWSSVLTSTFASSLFYSLVYTLFSTSILCGLFFFNLQGSCRGSVISDSWMQNDVCLPTREVYRL